MIFLEKSKSSEKAKKTEINKNIKPIPTEPESKLQKALRLGNDEILAGAIRDLLLRDKQN